MVSKLAKIRTSRGISQRRLEELSGVHQQTISRIEKGSPLNRLSTAQKLAKALDCEPSELIDVDSGFDKLLGDSIKNINNYIKATRELLDLTPRRASVLLNMEEKEYLDCENPNNPMPLEDALIICSVLFAEFTRVKLSTILHANSLPSGVSENEKRVLKELRSLTPEDQEKFINLIIATPLLK